MCKRESKMQAYLNRLCSLPKEIWTSRKLIWKLSKNDFKTRYAGSYLGIIWAFIQPLVTILVYWLVFEKGIGSATQGLKGGIEVPFLIYLTSGLIPWFFFSEAVMNSTNALIEYNYLVKKVVFQISILPVIKIVAACFIHAFFLLVLLVICSLYGYYPSLYTLQVLYYSFCLFMLVLALSYIFSSVVIFFRDLAQIVNIALQIGMWATPIMWNFAKTQGHPVLRVLFQLNPVYYVVNGYRQALFEQTWFWQNGWLTVYFWVFTGVVFMMGVHIFEKLRPHFADVL